MNRPTVPPEVEQALHVQPSEAAYRRMATAPWFTPSTTVIRRRIAAALLLLIVLSGLVWFTPALHSLAQNVLDWLFKRASTETTWWTIDATPTTPVPASVAETFGSVAAAESQTGQKIYQPDFSLIASPFTGVTVNHERKAIWLIFAGDSRYLSIYQRAAQDGWLDEGLVGQTAQITSVIITDWAGRQWQGEYVAGGWVLQTPTQAPATKTAANWTAQTAQKRLRWRTDTTVYEMMALDPDLTLARMVEIAASMR